MASWEDYKARARAKGVLGRELFVVLSKPNASAAEIEQALGEHLAYQKRLESEGRLFAAGPLGDEAGEVWSMEGLVVLRASSLEEARALAAADPIHAGGYRTCTVRPWLLNEGRLIIDLSLSAKSAELP